MKFELFVAARYLRAKRRQAVIGVITVISVIGVVAGVASLVIALSINAGFQKDLQDQLLGSQSHINLLRAADDGITDWPSVLDRLKKQPHVVAAAPVLYGEVLASGGEYDRMLERLGAEEPVKASGCALWVDRLQRETE